MYYEFVGISRLSLQFIFIICAAIPCVAQQTFNVNTTSDTHDFNPGDGVALDADGDVSLRSAIEEANAQPGFDVIDAQGCIFCSIYAYYATLPEPLIISDDVDIFFGQQIALGNNSPASEELVYPVRPFARITNGSYVYLRGGRLEGFTVTSGGVIEVESGSTLDLRMVLRPNSIGPGAHLILNEGNLKLSGFTSFPELVNGGPLILSRGGSLQGLMEFNASGLLAAPMLRIESGNVQLSASFNVNASGVPALEILGGDVELPIVSFSTDAGAAPMVVRGGNVKSGLATFRNVRGTNGGGLEVTGGEVSIDNATFADCEASGAGGAIFASNDARVSLRQVTLSSNSAQGSGGAIYAQDEASVDLINCTITGNTADADATGGELGAAFRTDGNARITLANTIIGANRLGGGNGDPLSAAIVSLGGNVVDQSAAGMPWRRNDRVGTAEAPLDLLLGPLVTAESFRRAHEPLAGSPAIDAANPALLPPAGDGMQFDTRGPGYRRYIGPGLDAGAAEFQDPALTPHSLDLDSDFRINIHEILRLIQFYNMPVHRYRCLDGTEDGYIPGSGGSQYCPRHASDFDVNSWTISLEELLRAIQLYNSPGYRPCAEGDDGFCVET